MTIIDGRKIADEIQQEIAGEVQQLKKQGAKIPHLAVIIVGSDGASETYVKSKIKTCEKVGFQSSLFKFNSEITEKELLDKIAEINNNQQIVQSPLPRHISEDKVNQAIHPSKDVDGFHPMNLGRLALNLPTYISATPMGIIELLKRYKIDTEGKHCVVIGRSHLVGTPMSILLSRNNYPGNCTVTLCHSKTKNLKEHTLKADILIAALGKAQFITADMVKQGAVVIDVGITRVKSDKTQSGFKLLGDVNYDEVAPKCSYITPVPGGVGPMTIVSLLRNTLLSAEKKIYQ
jgi:methylenetetrahydrofolate dehydrogenase (NADP+)/methenyltetrahydrofolate cyclohydrolase